MVSKAAYKQVRFVDRLLGEITVEETIRSDYKKEGEYIGRRIVLQAPADVKNLHMRVAAGQSIEKTAGGEFRVDGKLRLTFKTAPTAAPTVRSAANGKELLVPVRFGPGSGGRRQAVIEIEMMW